MPRYLVRRRTNVRSWIWPCSNGTAITLEAIERFERATGVTVPG